MGIEISCDEDAPVPRPSRLTLTCDLATSFFCRGFAHFDQGGNYVDNLAAAKRCGWRETGGKIACPEC